MAGPTVSVVTPVYNGQAYLAECIESVLAQTFADWEYVIVDNVSTDETASIARRYAARDSRIRLERPSGFLDVLSNHNRSLRAVHPNARYVKVLHADDWLYPECLERMVSVAETHPSVGLVSSFRLIGDAVMQRTPLRYPETVMDGREVVRWEMLGPKGSAWVTGSQSSVLLRADLVRRTPDFYDTTVWHTDTDAAYRVLMESDFGFVHQILTYTRRHPGALNPFANRVWSFISRDGRLLMRYGPRLLSAPDYRRALRRWLRTYGWWLAKQCIKPGRRGQDEFQEFQWHEIDYLMDDAGSDVRTRQVLADYRRLLRHPRAGEACSAGPPPVAGPALSSTQS
ncbi:MAG: glycosyltransferase [Chloroflexi bacterium]|nr:glycosyltransferase [Chloroflexota bacterium]